MAKGKYKVIYKSEYALRGENYDGKTHSFKEAQRILEEGHRLNKKLKVNPTMKIVRVKERMEERRSKSPFHSTDEIERKLREMF